MINGRLYAGLSRAAVLPARPPAEDEARAPHAFHGHVPRREAYSVARFAREASDAIEEARGQGLVPIAVGGTGLYFKARARRACRPFHRRLTMFVRIGGASRPDRSGGAAWYPQGRDPVSDGGSAQADGSGSALFGRSRF